MKISFPKGLLRQGIFRSQVCQPLQLDPYVGLGWGNTMLFDRKLIHIVPVATRPKQPEADRRPLSHDTWIYALAAALGRVSHIDQPLCLCRQHSGNAFGVAKRSIAQRIRASTEMCSDINVASSSTKPWRSFSIASDPPRIMSWRARRDEPPRPIASGGCACSQGCGFTLAAVFLSD